MGDVCAGVGAPCAAAVTKQHAPLRAEHLSAVAEAAIRLLPGNDRNIVYSDAQTHRALGVGTSFVKSLGMDSWTPVEQRALEAGGNAKWAAVCAGTRTFDLPIAQKYTSEVARAYKHRIFLIANATNQPTSAVSMTANEFLVQVAPELDDEVEALRKSLAEPSPRLSSDLSACFEPTSFEDHSTSTPSNPQEPRPHVETAELLVKCTTCRVGIPIQDIDSHSKRCVVSSTKSGLWRKYDRTFGRPGVSLGFSLTKTRNGFAEVTRVAPGGDADNADVQVGSYIVGLNEHKTSVFEDIVPLVSSLPRPLRFHFVARSASNRNSFESTTQRGSLTGGVAPVPEPVSVEVDAVFDDRVCEIGCTLQVQNNRCVVKHVDPGSAAQKQGVLVGACVSAVNGRVVLRGVDAIEAIQRSSRPLRINFHRVEGLMRGWKSS